MSAQDNPNVKLTKNQKLLMTEKTKIIEEIEDICSKAE